jgi:hypothetical protein
MSPKINQSINRGQARWQADGPRRKRRRKRWKRKRERRGDCEGAALQIQMNTIKITKTDRRQKKGHLLELASLSSS